MLSKPQKLRTGNVSSGLGFILMTTPNQLDVYQHHITICIFHSSHQHNGCSKSIQLHNYIHSSMCPCANANSCNRVHRTGHPHLNNENMPTNYSCLFSHSGGEHIFQANGERLHQEYEENWQLATEIRSRVGVSQANDAYRRRTEFKTCSQQPILRSQIYTRLQ